MNKTHLHLLVFLLSSLRACLGSPPQILFVGSDTSAPIVDAACDFYGLTYSSWPPDEAASEADRTEGGRRGGLAIVLEALRCESTATSPEETALFRRAGEDHIPLLVLGTKPGVISWPSLGPPGASVRIDVSRAQASRCSWQVTRADPRVTRELTGISGEVKPGAARTILAMGSNDLGNNLVPLISIQSQEGNVRPIFAALSTARSPVFFATSGAWAPWDNASSRFDRDTHLLDVMPILMFLRYAGGPYCWHQDSDYANLTIDDPWLTKRYGHLSYEGLLAEMKDVGFHTTIAFIPWNYDRSKPEVVSIFKEHKDRYSICVHGNDHDHREFYKYETEPKNPWPAKPFDVQESNIQQGLARMEEFKRLTGLDFDQVMVFPHSIAPSDTLGLLKKYNFLMTVNENNVPLDCQTQSDQSSNFRNVTLDYADFASVSRYYLAASVTPVEVAVDLFLDNPVIISDHHGLFRGGMDMFNKTAKLVNSIQPDIKWRSLRDIARHLHLLRLRDDGQYDVRAFCPSIEIENKHERAAIYFITKDEASDIRVKEVTVNGVPHRHVLRDGRLSTEVTVGPHQSCLIEIRYENDFDPSQVAIAKSDKRVNRLRALSDFRDLTLSRFAVARAFVDFYYSSGLYTFGLKGLVVMGGVFMTVLLVGCWQIVRYVRCLRLKIAAETECFKGNHTV